MDTRTERLKAAFNASGLTQTELCKRTGITKGALSSYLSGRYFPKQKALESLADALGVSVIYLMGFGAESDRPSDGSSALSPEEMRIIDMYRSLNAIGKRRAVQELEDLCQIDRYTCAAESNCDAV